MRISISAHCSLRKLRLDGGIRDRVFVCLRSRPCLIFIELLVSARARESQPIGRVRQRGDLHTVADQLAVAVNQAHLFAQMQQQALTDGLTGCYNRRSFELQLERDLHLATRMRQPLSLIMLDLDHFKYINDQATFRTAFNESFNDLIIVKSFVNTIPAFTSTCFFV